MNILKLQKNCTLNALKPLKQYSYVVDGFKTHAAIYPISRTCVLTDFSNNKTKHQYYSTVRHLPFSFHKSYTVRHNQWTIFSPDQRKENILLPPKSSLSSQMHVRHISDQVGDISLWTRVFLWMSESTPVSYAQDLLLTVHSSTGLPWWATIVVTTLFLRTVVTLPLAIYQNYILAKVENLQLIEMPEIVKELKRETVMAIKKFNWTEKEARRVYNRSVKKQWNKLVIRDNCHPFKASILLWVQIPMWITLSVALRNLVYMLPHQDGAAMVTYMEFSVGGFGWIPNLLIPDESLILPICLGLVNLAIVELQVMSKMRKDSKLQRYVTNIFRVLSLVMIPIAASVPSCLNLYWVTSSTYGLVQNLVLLSPQIKKLTKIPETPSQLEEPYKHIASEIRQRAARMAGFWKLQAKN